MNPPHTSVHPAKFDGDCTDTALSSAGTLFLYLQRLVAAESIPEFIAANPFNGDSGEIELPVRCESRVLPETIAVCADPAVVATSAPPPARAPPAGGRVS